MCYFTDFEGRGAKTPRSYLSGKSYLPKVLLTSNPLEERELQKKLTHITTGKTRRQRALEWNQRQFYISQIFDPDYNLRFNKELVRYTDQLDSGLRTSGISSRIRSSTAVCDSNEQRPDGRRVGLGVFMPPLHPSQRLIEKQKIPQSYQQQHKLITTGTADPNQKNGDQMNGQTAYSKRCVVGTSKRKLTKQRAIMQDDSTFMTPGERNGIEDVNVPSRNGSSVDSLSKVKFSRTVDDNNNSSNYHKTRKFSKSVSLPDIQLTKSKTTFDLKENRPVTYGIENGADINFLDDEEFPIDRHDDVTANDVRRNGYHQEVLCEDEVIDTITRTLPLSIMIKANQNINREVQKRRARLIEKCKNDRDKDTLNDPRWVELKKVLVTKTVQDQRTGLN